MQQSKSFNFWNHHIQYFFMISLPNHCKKLLKDSLKPVRFFIIIKKIKKNWKKLKHFKCNIFIEHRNNVFVCVVLYEGVSKIFWNGAVIYTAVVVG
jgi:hypothetical protein